MPKTILACAGAVLLSTAGLALAQGAPAAGVTVVPAGQTAPGATPAPAPAAPQPAPPAPAQAAQAAPAPAAGGAAAAATAPAAPEETQQAAAEAPPTGGMQLDAHPSADSAASGNAGQPTGANGMFVDAAGNPTYNISAEGADWFAWRGYKKFGANCLQCHGPDGAGSSFAPNLTESLQRINYFDFAGIIVSGQQNKWHPVNSIMPAWGEDPNVMCSLDAIYVYLRGRADGAIGRGEPKPHVKNKEAQDAEYACLGQ
ncbi:c-type cytochrome [Antarcticirhabdus aurantiaca]|uniref:C-type cytochrome n=1 Tax=Antarcticirhabdus aurantiaca TaxID=2606717 RepID=A0ACD4NKE1_9HYPH|nr:c-type cytochrome [Antarcticirhabdus aurantiaca]WAJ27285.1 c-type cytochrome [Jeongeuplla avenae]